MREAWRFEAERVVDEELLRRVDDVVFAADDHVDAHRVVVDDDGVVVGGHAVALHYDDVLYRSVLVDGGVLALEVEVAVDLVAELQLFARDDLEEYRAVLLVGLALVEKLLHIFLIEVHTLRLAVGAEVAALVRAFVPVEPHPAHAVEDALLVFLRRALHVRVFYAEYERASVPARVQPVEKGRVRAADVQRSRGARRESYSWFVGHCVFLQIFICSSYAAPRAENFLKSGLWSIINPSAGRAHNVRRN